MISDVLARVVDDLDHYLNDRVWDRTYRETMRERIIRLRDEANDIRHALHTPPSVLALSEAVPHEPDRINVREDGETKATTNGQDPRKARKAWVDWMMSDASAVELNVPFFNRNGLLARGWSRRLIDRILGNPDWTSTNPHIRGAAPMLCWKRDRVLAAENTSAFQEHCSRHRK